VLFSLIPFLLVAPAPQGYYDSVDDSDAASLRASLHALIDDHQRFPYSSSGTDTWTILEQADQDPSNGGRIVDLYRNESFAKQGGGNSFYNREHTWPNSYGFPNDGGDNYPYTDCHQLFLCDISYNGARDRLPFGTCSSGTCVEWPTELTNGNGGGTGVYPGNSNWAVGSGSSGIYEVWADRRGDVARALFYLDVRYEGGNHGGTGSNEPDLRLTDDTGLIASSFTGSNESVAYMGRLAVLLQWHEQDPPDANEIARNDVVQSYQGNRNPFVDHPEWVDCLYVDNCGEVQLSVDASSLDITNGGTVNLALDAGLAYRTQPYRVLGSTAGSIPGFNYQGIDIPLNPVGTYWDTTRAGTSPYLLNGVGSFDINGLAAAQVVAPAGLPASLDGLMVHHAYVVLDSFQTSVIDVSNAASFVLVAGGSGNGELVINEVDYDQPGTDTDEFIEIYNPGSAPIDLANVQLELWNGSGTVLYDSINLSAAGSSLAAGQYLVVGTNSIVSNLPGGTLSIAFAAADNNVQNGGSNGDGIKLVEGGVTLDSMSYEAIVAGVTEGANHAGTDDSGATESLARIPNGTDTDENGSDFQSTATVTPGAANQ